MQSFKWKPATCAKTHGCKRLMRLLSAANNQATRRNEIKKATFNWVQAETDMHPACPNKKQNHLRNSFLRRTQFWVRKTLSKPASLKRASLVAPVQGNALLCHSSQCIHVSLHFCCDRFALQGFAGAVQQQKLRTFFFGPSPLPFGGCTVLSLTRGPAENRTTTGSLSATQECRDTNCTTRTTNNRNWEQKLCRESVVRVVEFPEVVQLYCRSC